MLSNAPAGKHPDEGDDGVIHNPDGSKTRPIVHLAEGASSLTDPEPVKESEIPVEQTGIENPEIVIAEEV